MKQNGAYPRSCMGVRYIKVKCPECGERISQPLMLSDGEYVTLTIHCGKRFRVKVYPKGEYEISDIMG